MLTVFFQMHLVESVFQIQKGENQITMLVSQLVLNHREREIFPCKLGIKPMVVYDYPPLVVPRLGY